MGWGSRRGEGKVYVMKDGEGLRLIRRSAVWSRLDIMKQSGLRGLV